MANDDVVRGLQPLAPTSGERVQSHYYECDTAADLFLGSPVVQNAAGQVAAMAVGVAFWGSGLEAAFPGWVRASSSSALVKPSPSESRSATGAKACADVRLKSCAKG